MHIVLGALAIAAAVIFWILRVRAAAHAVSELGDVASDVRAAMRRLGYRRSAGHPADEVEDARLVAAGLLTSLARFDGDPTAEALQTIAVECRATFRCTEAQATDIAAFGRWLSAQNQSPHEAVRRLSRRLLKVASPYDRSQLAVDMERMMTAVAKAQDGETISNAKAHAIGQTRRMLDPE